MTMVEVFEESLRREEHPLEALIKVVARTGGTLELRLGPPDGEAARQVGADAQQLSIFVKPGVRSDGYQRDSVSIERFMAHHPQHRASGEAAVGHLRDCLQRVKAGVDRVMTGPGEAAAALAAAHPRLGCLLCTTRWRNGLGPCPEHVR
jgi:antitoxin (DNA-binding transcriptional repressor) of toxin-antitoxin stability system